MICFVAGPSGVGKTHFSKTIQEKYETSIYDTGPILRQIYTELELPESFSDWIRENEKKYGDYFAISVICEKIKEELNVDTTSIIVGNRCIEGIKYIVDYFNLKNYCIIYLDASYQCLKSNYEKREKISIQDVDFQERIEGGNQMGLGILKQYVLENLNNRCYYYYKEKNENLDYISIFNEVLKPKVNVKTRKK